MRKTVDDFLIFPGSMYSTAWDHKDQPLWRMLPAQLQPDFSRTLFAGIESYHQLLVAKHLLNDDALL